MLVYQDNSGWDQRNFSQGSHDHSRKKRKAPRHSCAVVLLIFVEVFVDSGYDRKVALIPDIIYSLW